VRILAALALLAGAAHAQTTVSKVELHACGVYERKVGAGGRTGRERQAHLVVIGSGVTGVEFVHMFSSFGCQVTLQGTPASGTADFRAVLRLPRGEASGSQSFRIGEAGYVGYTLRSADRGPNTLEIWVGEQKLAEKTFFVGAE
jgi:hypothetical protein